MSTHPEVYLGDGLYASFDGWHVILRVILRAPRIGGDHYITLEPEVMAALHNYLETLDHKYPGHFPRWSVAP
jgi:hypothetical protein